MVHVHEVRAEFDKQNQVYVIKTFSPRVQCITFRNYLFFLLFMIYDLNILFSHVALEEELDFLKHLDQFSDRQSIPTVNSRYTR